MLGLARLTMPISIAGVLLAASAYVSTRAVLAGFEKKIQSEGSQSEAQQLWERAVAAKGGRGRLRGITCLYPFNPKVIVN